MSNKKKRQQKAIGVIALVGLIAWFFIDNGPDIHFPKLGLLDWSFSDWHFPKIGWPDFSSWHIPDMNSVSGWFASVPSWGWAIIGLLVVGAIVYIKKYGRPHISIPGIPSIGGGKYVPRGRLSSEWSVVGDLAKLDWGDTLDNGIAAVCPKTGDLFIAGGDGDGPTGGRHETVVIRCKRGNDPRKKKSWSTYWTGGGKCYGLTVLKSGSVIGIKSRHGSMWPGAQGWEFVNFTTGEHSDVIDGWFQHARVGQFTFLNGKVDGTAYIYFLRAVKPKFQEFGGPVLLTTVKRSKLEHPSKLRSSDFSRTEEVPGFISPREGSGTHWNYAVQVDVFRDGAGRVLGALGEFVTAHVFRFRSSAPDHKFTRVKGHTGFGIPDGGNPRLFFHVNPGEHYRYGVFTQSVFYFNGRYWVSMSGSFQADGIYIGAIK